MSVGPWRPGTVRQVDVMSEADPFVELKQRQRAMWSSFAPTATFTTPVAGRLVTFAGVAAGERLPRRRASRR